jgi:peptidase M66-like protein/peptidase inhibitor family I36
MLRRKESFFFSFYLELCAGLWVLAAPHPVMANGVQPAGAVCFYADANYKGASLCSNADSAWIGKDWNDRAKSVRLRDGASAVLYKDEGFKGTPVVLNADTPDLGSLEFSAVLSSYRVYGLKLAIVTSVELAQTHVIPPSGRFMQSARDQKTGVVRRLTLVADRPALLMVKPAGAVAKLLVGARLANGKLIGPITMSPPSKLPATDGHRAPYATDRYSVLLPAAWIQVGTSLEIGQQDSTRPDIVPLTVTPGVSLSMKTMPVYLWGARATNSVVADFALDARTTNGYPLDKEYLQKVPLASFNQSVGAVITMDRVVVAPRNDAKECHPAIATRSLADFRALGGDMNAVLLNVISDFHGSTANRDSALPITYYGYMQTWDGSRQAQANSGGGLTLVAAGSSVSGGDYRPEIVYSAIFNHEVGHAYGLGHADTDYNQGGYPYPFGTKSGSSWGYDANKNELLGIEQLPGKSCGKVRVVNGICYEATPMSGGDFDLDSSTYRWTTFADYQASIMQEWFLSKAVLDDTFPGGYKKWNNTTGKFEALDERTRAAIGTDVLQTQVSVQNIYGTLSHFNLSPSATAIFVTPSYPGNLGRHIDPTVQADLDSISATTPGGWYGYYCLDRGCDYTLVASYADGSVERILLPTGYHQSGSGKLTGDGVRSGAREVLHDDNLARFAVNVAAGHGGLSKVELFSTPHTSAQHAHYRTLAPRELGTRSYPLVQQWTPADENSGGPTAPGRTVFNTHACQPGAKVTIPTQ